MSQRCAPPQSMIHLPGRLIGGVAGGTDRRQSGVALKEPALMLAQLAPEFIAFIQRRATELCAGGAHARFGARETDI